MPALLLQRQAGTTFSPGGLPGGRRPMETNAERRTVIVGIAGGSGSGKTTFANRLAGAIGRDLVNLIHHDSYYRDRSGISPVKRAEINYDHPDALETELLTGHLDLLRDGIKVEVPVYNFSTHCREKRTESVLPRPLILVEGILVLSDPVLAGYFDLRIFIDLDGDLLLARRIGRDVSERGRTVKASLCQYTETTRPMLHEYVLPSRKNADIVISGEKLLDDTAFQILGQGLKHLLGMENTKPGN